jgi:hypothetical protein
MTAPDWLTNRNGGLAQGPSERTWMVTLDGQPLWRLDARPAKGRFTCCVLQTNNGKRLDGNKEYATVDTALAGGLEELRSELGW